MGRATTKPINCRTASRQQSTVIEANKSEFFTNQDNRIFSIFSLLCNFAKGGLLGNCSSAA